MKKKSTDLQKLIEEHQQQAKAMLELALQQKASIQAYKELLNRPEKTIQNNNQPYRQKLENLTSKLAEQSKSDPSKYLLSMMRLQSLALQLNLCIPELESFNFPPGISIEVEAELPDFLSRHKN